MRSMKMIGLAAMAALTLTALVGAGSASATTLEIGGVTQNESVTIDASLKAGTDTTFQFTGGYYFATCTGSKLQMATESPYTGKTGPVSGKVSTLSFLNCSNEIEVISPGALTIESIPSSTNGTLVSSGAEWKIEWGWVGLKCSTGAGTHIGRLTWGAPGGHATLDVNAVLNCEGEWVVMKGTYNITSPTGLGVSP